MKIKVATIETDRPNMYFCPQVMELLDSYLYLFFSWNGFMLVIQMPVERSHDPLTVCVEGWLNTIKNTTKILKEKASSLFWSN